LNSSSRNVAVAIPIKWRPDFSSDSSFSSFFDSEREYDYAADEAMAVGRFFRSKFSPLAALMMNTATGRTVGRDEVTPAQIIYDNSVTLSLRDVSDAVEVQGFMKGGAMWLTSLFGVGMNTYEDN